MVEADTTDRQVLLDLVTAVQSGHHQVTVDSVTQLVREITQGKAQVTQLQRPAPELPKTIVPRIGDAERTATCDLLATHFMEGRITQQEFDERSAKAIEAHVQAELDALLVDMPKITPAPPRPPVLTPRQVQEKAQAAVLRNHNNRVTHNMRQAAIMAYCLLGLAVSILLLVKFG